MNSTSAGRGVSEILAHFPSSFLQRGEGWKRTPFFCEIVSASQNALSSAENYITLAAIVKTDPHHFSGVSFRPDFLSSSSMAPVLSPIPSRIIWTSLRLRKQKFSSYIYPTSPFQCPTLHEPLVLLREENTRYIILLPKFAALFPGRADGNGPHVYPSLMA